MPPVDEQHLRDLARHLANLYQELNSLKYSRPTPPEARVMKPTPGPQSPGNWLYVATYLDQEQRLREVSFNAFADIGVRIHDNDAAAPRLCQLLAFHAQAASELNWATDLMDELTSQIRIIDRRCNPPQPNIIAKQPEPRRGAEHIARQLRARGIPTTADTIRGWARSGHITRATMPNGRGGYLLTEALNHAHHH
ncbi:hypothetical protein [Corynebacterium sp. HMSC076D02]|uniref:hypothetical protein n=1 Tax=Corynebacterium sp. HMSC076D02 TaxID=1739439 RepID=UPI0008A3E4FB|nr:hypothetical protein [Corynebacterium sp. HMSC076D02]OFQ48115.1 hypothetical protein HMPREF2935_00820 [Corynebacterium sp. HMSC076D02]